MLRTLHPFSAKSLAGRRWGEPKYATCTKIFKEMLYLIFFILTENSLQLCGSNYLRTHGTAMGTKMAVAFANIFMAGIERQILCQSCIKPLFWKRYMSFKLASSMIIHEINIATDDE